MVKAVSVFKPMSVTSIHPENDNFLIGCELRALIAKITSSVTYKFIHTYNFLIFFTKIDYFFDGQTVAFLMASTYLVYSIKVYFAYFYITTRPIDKLLNTKHDSKSDDFTSS